MLYLDNAATTELNKEVLDEMLKALSSYGNSEAKYYAPAEEAKKLIAQARAKVANIINANESEIVFTSGATEANNMVLKGFCLANLNQKKRIVISAIEHSSIYDTCKFLESLGIEIAIVPVNKTGEVDLKALDMEITDDTILVSIIYVNNEIGTIQNLHEIDKICEKHKVALHIDATQAIGKVKLDFKEYNSLKFTTFTSHKIYGPKGIGCLVCKEDGNGIKPDLIPLLHGGEQEFGLRAGTLPTALIVGFGKACEIAQRDFDGNQKILLKYENIVIDKLKKKFGTNFIQNNEFPNRIPGLLNVRLVGYNNMILLKAISSEIAASTGSACALAQPSRILKNIGLTDEEISQSIRISISAYCSEVKLSKLDLL